MDAFQRLCLTLRAADRVKLPPGSATVVTIVNGRLCELTVDGDGAKLVVDGRVVYPADRNDEPEAREWAARAAREALPLLDLFERGTEDYAAALEYARLVAGADVAARASCLAPPIADILDCTARLHELIVRLARTGLLLGRCVEAVQDELNDAALGARVCLRVYYAGWAQGAPWWRWDTGFTAQGAPRHLGATVGVPPTARGRGWAVYVVAGLLRGFSRLTDEGLKRFAALLRRTVQDIERHGPAWLEARGALSALR